MVGSSKPIARLLGSSGIERWGYVLVIITIGPAGLGCPLGQYGFSGMMHHYTADLVPPHQSPAHSQKRDVTLPREELSTLASWTEVKMVELKKRIAELEEQSAIK